MYKIKIKTTHNVIELIIDDYFSEEIQEIINQPYVEEVYLRCIDYENIDDYKDVKRLVKEKSHEQRRTNWIFNGDHRQAWKSIKRITRRNRTFTFHYWKYRNRKRGILVMIEFGLGFIIGIFVVCCIVAARDN